MEDKPDYKLTEDYRVKLDALRRALKEGEESGLANYSIEELVEELDK